MESHYASDAGGRVVPLFPDFTTRWEDAESGWDEQRERLAERAEMLSGLGLSPELDIQRVAQGLQSA